MLLTAPDDTDTEAASRDPSINFWNLLHNKGGQHAGRRDLNRHGAPPLDEVFTRFRFEVL